ncbi:MAG: DUF354 domain-containing protein [Gammaproteobacteria bacterium]
MTNKAKLIWIDLDNSPHVPFFRPIIAELQGRGYPVLVTARDACNVAGLIRLRHVECTTIGRHFGKNKLMKVLGLGIRAAQLLHFVAKNRVQLAVSRGSRAQTLVAKLMRIKAIRLLIVAGARPNFMKGACTETQDRGRTDPALWDGRSAERILNGPMETA